MCNKKPLTKEGAICALRIIRGKHNNRKADKKPRRFYYCKECEAWHLTSQTNKQFYSHRSKKHEPKFKK